MSQMISVTANCTSSSLFPFKASEAQHIVCFRMAEEGVKGDSSNTLHRRKLMLARRSRPIIIRFIE